MIVQHWRFFLSCLLSFTAGHIINYSVIIYAQEMLHSDLLSGLGFGLCFGPPLLLGWYAGVLCDRLAPGRIIHAAQLMFILAALLLTSADQFFGTAQVFAILGAPLVMLAALCAGVGWSFVAPARMTTLSQIVAPTALRKATLMFNLLVMLGFGLGPLTISVTRLQMGWRGVFMLAISLFVIASVLLIGTRTRASLKVHRPILIEIAEGVRAVQSHPLLRQLLIAAMFGYLLMGPLQVILPKLARTAFGLTELERGAFLGTLAPSLIIGGLLCMLLIKRLPHGPTIFIGCAGAGALFAVLGVIHNPLLAFSILACVGILGGMAISLIVTGIQENVDEAVRGRVLSMYTIISQVMPAVSGVIAGILTHLVDAQLAVILCGVALAAAGLVNSVWMRHLWVYRGQHGD